MAPQEYWAEEHWVLDQPRLGAIAIPEWKACSLFKRRALCFSPPAFLLNTKIRAANSWVIRARQIDGAIHISTNTRKENTHAFHEYDDTL
jgi:hypothetical protein